MTTPTKYNRRSIRLQGYDYTQSGAYFVTICTQGSLCIFGDVTDGIMNRNPAGEAMATAFEEIPEKYPGIDVDEFIIMPNHVHAIIILNSGRPCKSGRPRGGARTDGDESEIDSDSAPDLISSVRAGPRARPEIALKIDSKSKSGRPFESGRPQGGARTDDGPRARPDIEFEIESGSNSGRPFNSGRPQGGAHTHNAEIDCESSVRAGPRARPEIDARPEIEIESKSNSGRPRGGARTDGIPSAGPKIRSLSDVVHDFKSWTTHVYSQGVKQQKWPPFPGRLWHRNFYERIIRDEDELNRIREYILTNPMAWDIDENNPNRRIADA